MSRHFSWCMRRSAVASLTIAFLTVMPTVCSRAAETQNGRTDGDSATTEIVNEGEASAERGATADTKVAEEPAAFDSKRPSILGMTVVEDESGRPKVVDVGAASPAWDAGIRKGDIIVSLHDVDAKSFQEWVDGVKKVVADAVAGQTVPIELVRDEEPLDLQVRLPMQRADKARRQVDRQPPAVGPNQPAGVPQLPGAIPPAGGRNARDGAYGLGGAYPAGGGFGVAVADDDGAVATDAAADRVPMQAVAQLFAVNRAATPQGVAAGAAGRVSPGTAVANRQVGVAEFRDDENGMTAAVALAGLPAGSYRVGIGEVMGGAIAAPGGPFPIDDGFIDGAPSRPGRLDERRQQTPASRNRNGAVPPNAQPGTVPAQPAGSTRPTPSEAGAGPGRAGLPGAPADGTAGGTSGGGGTAPAADGAQLERQANYVLAQQAVPTGSDPSAVGGRAADAAVTGGLPPSGATPTGQEQNSAQARPGQPREGHRGTEDVDRSRSGPFGNTLDSGAGTTGQIGLDLGVINIGVGGGGQLQQRLEGVRVASIIGQSVVVIPAGATSVDGVGPFPRPPRDRNGRLNPRQLARLRDPRNFGVVAVGEIQPVATVQPARQTPAVDGTQPAVQPGQLDANGNVQAPAPTPPAPNRN